MQILLASVHRSTTIEVQRFLSCYGRYSWRFLVYVIYSAIIYAFLFFVVCLPLVGIFERLAKTLQFLKKIHGIQLYLNLFTPSRVTNVNTYLHMLYTENRNIFYSSKITRKILLSDEQSKMLISRNLKRETRKSIHASRNSICLLRAKEIQTLFIRSSW